MKKTVYTLLALLLCLGGMTPMVFAEEIETEPEEVTVEDIQDEANEEVEEAAEDEEIAEENVQEESSKEETAEEPKQSTSDYEILPTDHGTVRVLSSISFEHGRLINLRKIICMPDEGYEVASVKVLDDTGKECTLTHDGEGIYCLHKEGFVTIEAVFEGVPHPLYTCKDDPHHVTFMADDKPVTEARPGQTVQAVIELDENECVKSLFVRDHCDYPYEAELISETDNQTVYQFTMIDDEAELVIGYGVLCVDENGETHRMSSEKINSARDLTLTTGWYVLNGDVTIDHRVEVRGHVNLILPDDTTFTCKDGIHNREGNTLTIWGQKKGTGYLDVQHAGLNNAGIGGNEKENGGTFNLHGGRVDAEAGVDAAGVGGGMNGDGGIIRVYGGYLHGHGNDNGAGIGGGEYGRGGDIRIYGGEVFGEGDSFDWFTAGGAGIGGGEDRDGGYIEINGGIVQGKGSDGWTGGGAGIGGGDEGDGGTIVINGGDITASSDGWGAGIGGGNRKDGGSITINGGAINAKSREGAGIGAGKNGACGSIVINGGSINAETTDYSSAIGTGGSKSKSGTISITGGTIDAYAHDVNHYGGRAVRARKDNTGITIGDNVFVKGDIFFDYFDRIESLYTNRRVHVYTPA